ncbi:hypothetical protein QWY14_10090 [Planococcus sp. N028]|uniref:PylC N-terminal domain-containing protein n=1 Tax=Planococcus shixiaomingii TaxID=3058393 RepID=A0ABT8N2N1_9BACL|nr:MULTISPECIES: hypothetical protein [unclassified Planococcus (in: firmicutes)]MDN7242151.1 hypothetical protein [Planococcus sp. N028]WKA54424.1 hypothetical protein QWY21_17390 [Planococcus sp. N022]
MMTRKKKVLILSGASHMIEAVEIAKNSGLHTIVADNRIAPPAKKHADNFYSISPDNIEQIADMARSEEIDGIFTIFDDINTWHALALCKKLDLPLYTAKEQLANRSTDYRFREYCRIFNVPVVDSPAIEKLNKKEVARRKFSITKPVAS